MTPIASIIYLAAYSLVRVGALIVAGAAPSAPPDPTEQPLHVLSAIVGALCAAGILAGIGAAALSAMGGLRAKNLGEALGGVGRGLFVVFICVLLLAGSLVTWFTTTGGSSVITPVAH